MTRRKQHGLTLVELMIGLVLGLVLTGAAFAAFLGNRQVYALTESLGRVQENSRAAFELMARDIREAGANPCNSGVAPANVVRNAASVPYADFGGGILGQTVNGFDALAIRSAVDSAFRIDPDNSSNVNIATHEPVPADWVGAIVMACDPEGAAIFQITDVDPDGVKIQVRQSQVPGNASNCIAPDGNCPNGAEKRYAFGCTDGLWKGGTPATATKPAGCVFDGAPPAVIARMRSVTWFVGPGSKAGSSLYRRIDGPAPQTDEIAEFVDGLTLRYLLDGEYRAANAIGTDPDEWARVTAVRIDLAFRGEDESGSVTRNEAVVRRVATTVALRNRLP